MAPTFTATNTTVSIKAQDIISSALKDLGVVAQDGNVDASDSSWGLENLQRRIDLVNAQRELIYSETFELYTLLTNTQPITIGPSGQFNRAYPPIRIPTWGLILPGGTAQTELCPIRTLTESEWAAITVKKLTSTLPIALYYERGFPLGNLNFWPIPTQANQVRLRIWVNLAQALALSAALAMPPAYWMYLQCAIASDMAPSYGPRVMEVVQGAAFQQKYREALNSIKDNNNDVPPMQSGVPSGKNRSAIPDYNFLTGLRR